MISIKKSPEPRSLTQYKAANGQNARYDGLTCNVKSDIRRQLLDEQGYLCAYCMSRISEDNMKIEHWACQKYNAQSQLDYSNMLACCKGREGHSYNEQTCDTHKGDNDIKYNPSDNQRNIEHQIKYNFGDGKINSPDLKFNTEIERVLNLNFSRLCQNRLVALDIIRKKLGAKNGLKTKDTITNLLRCYTIKNPKRIEYVGIIIYYLQNKL